MLRLILAEQEVNMKTKRTLIAIMLLMSLVSIHSQEEFPVFQANGIKVGEVSQSSAIVWTRLTQSAERKSGGVEWKESPGIPEGHRLEEMQDSVTGAPGEIRISWTGEGGGSGETEWLAVQPGKDFTRQVRLDDLKPGETYRVEVQSRSPEGEPGQAVVGSFVTAPAEGNASPVRFQVVTGQEFSRRDDAKKGHRIYQSMLKQEPHFFVHTGDIVYYDFKRSNPKATNAELARFKWNRMYSLPFQRAFHNEVASYFIKDDHDTVKNDCWPEQSYGDLTWKQGLEIFREQVPMGEKTYRTVRWGKDLQVWMMEGRDFRSPNTMKDGPEKTIWGREQKKWFFETVKESDATFRILISPTPIVGPDRGNKNDNHANKGFTHEGNEIRNFLAEQENLYVICGDRHWQYVSEDPETGVREYSCGPTSMAHAGGFSEEKRSSMHRYLKVQGGFLSVEIDRIENQAQATFRHHGVDGEVHHTEVIKAQ